MDEFLRSHTILLTGSSGVVGTDISLYLAQMGFRIRPLIRSGENNRYHFDDIHKEDNYVVIHAGVPFHPRSSRKRKQYFLNTLELFESARHRDFKLIFVSSQSSRSDNPSFYSRDKKVLEQAALSKGFRVIRLGVYLPTLTAKKALVTKCVEKLNVGGINRAFRCIPSTNSKQFADAIIESLNDWNKPHDEIDYVLSAFEEKQVKNHADSISNRLNSRYGRTNSSHDTFKIVTILNFATYGLIDPIINLMYDLRYYAK